MWLKEWTTDDFIAYCDKLDRDTAFMLKEYVARINMRCQRAENELSDQRWIRDGQLGYIQGSN
jgi:hypothetical protein